MITDLDTLSDLLKLYTPKEVGRKTDLSTQTIYNVIRKKTSNHKKVNLNIRTIEKLNMFLAKKGMIDA